MQFLIYVSSAQGPHMMKSLKVGVVATALVVLSAGKAAAMNIAVDQILFDPTSANGSLLSGTVDMTLSGNILTIILTNTSVDAAGDGAGILLTGIGFQLPSNVKILGGTASAPLGAVNFGGAPPVNVSQEWGYDNNPLNSGAFQAAPALAYTTVVSSMTSTSTDQFASGSLDGNPAGMAGPDWGIVSALETGSLGNGNEAIKNYAVITLTLSGPVSLDAIQQGNVGLSFGSPKSVPEPATLALLLPGLAAVYAARRRKAKLQ